MSNHSKYPNKAGIYKLTCDGKVYIGKAINLNRRLNAHKNSGNNSKVRYYIQNTIVKYGWDSFTVEILEIVEDFDKLKDNDSLLEREAHYIELFDSTNKDKGYNLCKFSTDTTGRKHSDETKERIRQYRLGKTLTEESKDKVRQSKLGKPRSEETKEKIRKSIRNKKILSRKLYRKQQKLNK